MQAGADRGQSIQVGAVLLFGVLVILLATWQAVVVPQENEGIEFDHSRSVQGDVQELRNAIVSSGDGGTTVGVDIQLGTTYPTRVLFVNPDPPTGAIRTVGTASDAVNVSVRNASAAGDAGDFWDGQPRNYTTGGMVYVPSYNRYDNAPRTTYENSLLYNDFGQRNLTLAGQALIDGNRITLVTLNGSLDRTRADATTVDVRPVTASRSRLGVVNATGTNTVTIGIPTHLSAQNWTTLLDEQLMGNGGHVHNVTSGPAIPGTDLHVVNIHLQHDVQYRLSLARVGVGTNVNTTIPARYLTRSTGNSSLVPENTTKTLEVRTWDRFNNPVGGVSVQANTSSADSEVEVTDTSDDDGRIELRYEAPTDIDGGAQTDQVNVSMTMQPSDAGSGFDPATPTNGTFDLTVDNADRSGTGGAGSGGRYNLSWDFTQIETESGVTGCFTGNNTCVYNLSEDSDTQFDMTVGTSPTAVDAFVDFFKNSSYADLNPSEARTDASGEAVTTFSVPSGSPGASQVHASSTADSDGVVVKVLGSTGATLVINEDATAEDPDSQGTGSGIEFNVTNGHRGQVEITNMTISSPASGASFIDENEGSPGSAPWDNEIYISADTDGLADDKYTQNDNGGSGFSLGTQVTLNETAMLNAGNAGSVQLYQFDSKSGGNITPVEMSGQDVTIEITYIDPSGNTQTVSKTLTVS